MIYDYFELKKKLKNCPFCDANQKTLCIGPTSEAEDYWTVSCNKCLCEGPVKENVYKAIDAWNKRSDK